MIIVGAKGLAKEVLEIFARQGKLDNLFFFDDVSSDVPDELFGRFGVIRSIEQVRRLFHTSGDHSFTLGLGNPSLRFQLAERFLQAGGKFTSAISPACEVGSFDTVVAEGCTILAGAVITNNVKIGRGVLINPHCSVSHDSVVGDYCELSPGARVTGNCQIGDYCVLGTNASILPRVKLGTNVIVGAGAVVTKDVADNTVVAGVPAVVKRSLPPVTR